MKNRQAHLPPAATRWPYALQGLGSLLWIPQAWLIARAVAALMAHETGNSPGLAEALTPVWQAALGVALLGLLRAILEYAGTRATYGYARQTLTALREALGARLRSSSPLDARRPPSGQITSAWMEQAEAVVPWLARYQAAQWRVLIVAPVIALCVGLHTWVAALLLLIAAPLIPLFMAIIGWRAQAISEEQLQSLGHLHGHLLERLRGLPTLRALHAVDATANRLSTLGRTVAGKTMKVLRVAMLSSAVLELFSALGVALVAVYIGFHLLGQLPFGAWGGKLSLHSGLFVLMLAPSFFEPLRELSAVWHDRANGRAAMQSLDGLLDELAPFVVGHSNSDSAAPTPQAPVPLPIAAPDVVLQQVRPALPVPVTAHLDGPDGSAAQAAPRAALDVTIPAGAHVAVSGPSGSGKSMLLALVAGLVQADNGEVRVGGQTMDAAHAQAIRARIGWMGQHPHFFAGTIRRNLYLGREPLNAAAEADTLLGVGLAEVAQRIGGAPLGEAGAGISGGEALRLALARLAVAQQADLLLLDEPTAHLDSHTAAQVLATIQRLAQGKTLLVATHDPRVIAALPSELALDANGQVQWRTAAEPREVQA